MHVLRRAIVAALLPALAACGDRSARAPTTPHSIAGQITAVDRTGDRTGTVWVDAVPAAAGGLPRAAVQIEQDTDIVADSARASFSALGLGQYVRVWFRGPVQESDPVRASAATIAVDSTADGPP